MKTTSYFFIIFMYVSFVLLFGAACKKKDDSKTNKTLEVTAPVIGDTLHPGTSFKIKWTSTNVNNVFIQLFKDNVFYAALTRATESDGEYTWMPEPSTVDVKNYKIKITDLDDNTVYSESQSFRITKIELTNVPYIRVLTPNGGEVWSLSGVHEIRWERNFTGLVKVLLVNNGVIQGEVPGNGTTGNSMLVTFGSGNYYISGNRIRVCDASNYNLYDESDADFSFSR